MAGSDEVYKAEIGEGGEIRLPTISGGFASLGLKPGSTVYVSVAPPYVSNSGYPAGGAGPIIIVTGEPKKAEAAKEAVSEVYKRL